MAKKKNKTTWSNHPHNNFKRNRTPLISSKSVSVFKNRYWKNLVKGNIKRTKSKEGIKKIQRLSSSSVSALMKALARYSKLSNTSSDRKLHRNPTRTSYIVLKLTKLLNFVTIQAWELSPIQHPRWKRIPFSYIQYGIPLGRVLKSRERRESAAYKPDGVVYPFVDRLPLPCRDRPQLHACPWPGKRKTLTIVQHQKLRQ